MRDAAELAQNNDPLNSEAQLSQRRERTADQYAREPGVEQANPLDIGARQPGTKSAAEHINGAKERQRLGGKNRIGSAERVGAIGGTQSNEKRNIQCADTDQET